MTRDACSLPSAAVAQVSQPHRQRDGRKKRLGKKLHQVEWSSFCELTLAEGKLILHGKLPWSLRTVDGNNGQLEHQRDAWELYDSIILVKFASAMMSKILFMDNDGSI